MFLQYKCMHLYITEGSGKLSLSPNAMQHFMQPTGFTMNHKGKAVDQQKAEPRERVLWYLLNYIKLDTGSEEIHSLHVII